jgi:ACS family sodium-dependent inorganic phosphate cotransporter
MGMQIIGGWLANRYGGRAVLGVCLLLWSLFTLITPLAASVSLPVLIAVRILMGAGEAGLSPSALNLICRWAPEVVRARSIALFSSAASLGTLAALLLTGMIAQAYGWQMAFYIFGVLGMMLAIIWFRVIYDSPQQHPGISAAELEEAPVLEESADKAIPWRLIFTSRATWAIFITYFCVNWSLYVFIAWLPSYFAKAQSLNFSEAGFFSALPWLSMAVFMVIGGWLSDYLIVKKVRVLTVRKLLTCGGLLGSGCAIFFMPMASSPLMAMLLMSGALSIVAFSYSGVVTNILDCLPEYSDVVFGVTNTLGSLPGIVGIAIAGWLVDTTGSYNSVFYLTLSVQITGAIVFFLFSQDKKLVKAATRKKLGAVLDK